MREYISPLHKRVYYSSMLFWWKCTTLTSVRSSTCLCWFVSSHDVSPLFKCCAEHFVGRDIILCLNPFQCCAEHFVGRDFAHLVFLFWCCAEHFVSRDYIRLETLFQYCTEHFVGRDYLTKQPYFCSNKSCSFDVVLNTLLAEISKLIDVAQKCLLINASPSSTLLVLCRTLCWQSLS